MASIYDNIKTARELVQTVRISGLSTAAEDICRAQDIFGHSTIEDLEELANDTGRNNENGEPDPNGSWSSGRAATRGTFYSILFNIWNWEDATRFWNQHSNPEYEELKTLREDRRILESRIEKLTARRDELLEQVKIGADATLENWNKFREQEERAEAAEAEIVKLKARLYDLLIKE